MAEDLPNLLVAPMLAKNVNQVEFSIQEGKADKSGGNCLMPHALSDRTSKALCLLWSFV